MIPLGQRFQRLESKQAQRLESATGHVSPYSMSVGLSKQARVRNRYTDIIPFDNNRVRLRTAPDYINASHVKSGSQRWIAAQGPLPETILDFWQMVQENASIVIMLCNIEELGRTKCAAYWPTQPETELELIDEKNRRRCHVSCVSQTVDKESRSTKLTLDLMITIGTDVRRKSVTHIHFGHWPDHDVADLATLTNLVKQIRSIVRTSEGEPVIHCSAGCGRTGTFIALSALLENPTLRIDDIVDGLRKQRIASVQTLSQYELLHRFVDSGNM